MRIIIGTLILAFVIAPAVRAEETCIDCHRNVTPAIVKDWQAGRHSQVGVSCSTCHGKEHASVEDADKAAIPTPETCAACHKEKVEQYKRGKHAKAWFAMKAMPAFHWQPMALTEGLKGCGGCHKIGVKTEADMKELREAGQGFGIASCDSCHTRHTFSRNEALQPQACQTCHMGFDHPQWEMYSSSKHGVRYLMKQSKLIPDSAPAPSCQSCHVANGNHENRTAWGFLAVRLPMPPDRSWADDRTVILQALGVLDEKGAPTRRFDAVKQADIVRLTEESWQERRQAMIKQCGRCHAASFAKLELEKSDAMIREADRLMAEAVRIVTGVTKKLPDVLTFHDAATPIEQKLFRMFMEYRMRTFQGAFHNNPDYTLWYGWSEMKQALTEIRQLADQTRKK